MTDAFEVCAFDRDAFFRLMSNDWVSPRDVESNGRSGYFIAYLTRLGAQTIVAEMGYNDADFLDDFASFYVRCFSSYERRCRRLHFFRNRFTVEDFEALLSAGKDEAVFQANYLGFVVARPLPQAVYGRTVLAAHGEAGDACVFPCTFRYNANLFGISLSVESLAFQEQDTVVAACASVSLWCAFQKAASLFGTNAPKLATITNVANQVVNHARPFPSHGLNILQICNAVRYVGLEPEVFQVTKELPLLSLIYGHVKMGIPVILMIQIDGVGLHAATVVGYSMKDDPVLEREVSRSVVNTIPMTGLWIDQLYVHDDQVGPFAPLRVLPAAANNGVEYPVTFGGRWMDFGGANVTVFPIAVVIPVYNKIRISWVDVQKRLIPIYTIWRSVIGKDTTLDFDLVPSNVLKSELRGSQLPSSQRLAIATTAQPRFVWRARFSWDGKIAFDILADATGMSRSFPFFKIIWHSMEAHNLLGFVLREPSFRELLEEILSSQLLSFVLRELG